jgi:hypothetical protein
MASNKNQHFVPKAYLRAFTHGQDGRAIDLLHMPSGKAVFGAPVRNQCSANYFYGKDPLLEDAIQTVEGAYAQCVSALQADPDTVTSLQDVQLRRFLYLQHLRTEASARHIAEYTGAIAAMAPGVMPDMTRQEMMRTSIIAAMHGYADSMRIVDDLKLRIVRNQTSIPFVTSDDPALLLNRWHQGQRANLNASFGVGSAGVLMLMPLTPRLAVMLFDGAIYSVPHNRLIVRVHRPNDVLALNAIQALHCNVSLYFDGENGLEAARSAARLVKDRRPGTRLVVTYAVKAETSGEYTRYAVTDRPDFEAQEDMLAHTMTIRAVPPSWPSFIGLKNKRSAWVDASGKYLRESIAMSRPLGSLRKVAL